MEKTVLFRNFDERDIDFIYKCKNDPELNKMIVGHWHPFTYEEAIKWVQGCMGDHNNFKFWAICTNDEEKRIVGWVSLSNIDMVNQSACHHGLVIADRDYKDGFAMFEAMVYSIRYAFETIGIHRLYGSCFAQHPISPYMLNSLGFILEGTRHDAAFKNNNFYDIQDYGMLSNVYYKLKDEGRFEINTLVKIFIKNNRIKKR